jgi:mRNA-degrading endonuclease YafQ of YafQ-DinJ toxin-antitoxin module
LWSFSVDYDCRVVFSFVEPERSLFVDIGTHDDVY